MSRTTDRPTVIKGGAGAVAPEAVMDRFDPASVQVMRNPAGAAEAARQIAFDQGYQDGLAQARQDVVNATEESNRRVRRALAALSEAVTGFDQRQTVALAHVEDAIVAGAFALATQILQREIITASDPGGDALARALQLIPDRGDVTARLHPDDVATLNLERISSPTRTINIVADPSVELGGCVLEVGEQRIDGQLSSALDNARRAMGLDQTIEELAEPVISEDVKTARRNAGKKASAGSTSTPSRKTATGAPKN